MALTIFAVDACRFGAIFADFLSMEEVINR